MIKYANNCKNLSLMAVLSPCQITVIYYRWKRLNYVRRLSMNIIKTVNKLSDVSYD